MPDPSWFTRMESVQRQLARLITEPVLLECGNQVEVVGLVVLNGRMRLMVQDDLQQREVIDFEEVQRG
jgi:hypothetical protein